MEKVKVLMNDIIDLIKENLSNDGSASLKIKGNSMFPFYKDGKTEVTLIKPIFPLIKLDVILYHVQEKHILHRIVAVKDEGYVVCGDALKENEFVKQNQIEAVVISHKNKEKLILETQFFYRLMVRKWLFLKPIRRYLIKLFRILKKEENQ
ncbi:MAG: S24/S26 family peptidase [Firmicutes bacterium]|nr:S24/S26 family peptidase [Bacillota bacterium]